MRQILQTLGDVLTEAWGELWRARVRTLLAMGGMIVGAAALTLPVALQAMMSHMAAVQQENAWLKVRVPNAVLAQTDPLHRRAHLRRSRFTPADIEAVRKGCRDLASLNVETSSAMGAEQPTFKAGRHWCNGGIQGRDAAVAPKMLAGRFFTPAEVAHAAPVVVINKGMRLKLFGNSSAADAAVRVNGERFTVTGVFVPELAEREPALNDIPMAIIPTTTMDDLCPEITWTFSVLPKPGMARRVRGSIDAILTRRMGDPGESFTQRRNNMIADSDLRMLTYVGLVGFLALLSAGVALANKAYIDVLERLRYIAVRRALGATVRRIYGAVMLESILLCAGGCLIGCGLGSAAFAMLVTRINASAGGSPMNPQPSIVALSGIFLFVIALGAIAALQAASLAAKADPAEVLAREDMV